MALQIYGNWQIHKSVAKKVVEKSSVRNLQDLSVKRTSFSLGGVQPSRWSSRFPKAHEDELSEGMRSF